MCLTRREYTLQVGSVEMLLACRDACRAQCCVSGTANLSARVRCRAAREKPNVIHESLFIPVGKAVQTRHMDVEECVAQHGDVDNLTCQPSDRQVLLDTANDDMQETNRIKTLRS